jgi:hypothetical protein
VREIAGTSYWERLIMKARENSSKQKGKYKILNRKYVHEVEKYSPIYI